MHAIVVSDNAYAVGKSLDDLSITARRVSLIAIRRDGKEEASPSPYFTIKPRDVVVISGKPRRVERVEKYLLDGG